MAHRPSFPRRGSVYRVAFDPARGHEIHKTRPAVVVSSDHLNELADVVIIMPVTSGQYRYYHWIPLDPPEGGLTKPSSIITEHVRAVDKRRVGRRLGEVEPGTMEKIEQAIRDNFGLSEGEVLLA
ncbi:MAG: type II toxin-antitoxin system PemK/MazF family toxin [Pirellulales bacterium]